MQELGLRGNKIKLLQDAGYTFEDACTYVMNERVELSSPSDYFGVEFTNNKPLCSGLDYNYDNYA